MTILLKYVQNMSNCSQFYNYIINKNVVIIIINILVMLKTKINSPRTLDPIWKVMTSNYVSIFDYKISPI